jgi:hypothetical protein
MPAILAQYVAAQAMAAWGVQPKTHIAPGNPAAQEDDR